MKRSTTALFLGLALSFAVAATVTTQATAAQDAGAAFEKLKSLAGNWQAKSSMNPATPVSYEIVSGGSAVMEKLDEHGKYDMVTIYHRDGDRLMLTHYCAANNQPRMRLESASADGKTLKFSFLDVTNLAKPTDGHMRQVEFNFQDADHFTQTWTFIQDGKDQVDTFEYARKK